MVQSKTSPCRTLSSDRGWVIALVLMTLAVTLGLTLASASLVLFHVKSSGAFSRILQGILLSEGNGRTLTSTTLLLGAPEGWDHKHFFTRVTDQGVENVRSYSWRVAQRDPCQVVIGDVLVPSRRPHIVVIVDDSIAMKTSSGHDYADDALYLKRPAGGIVHLSSCCEIAETFTCTEGTYFRGAWGNTNERASSPYGLYGSMPSWTFAFSAARALIETLHQCEIAVMSTSRGLILPFCHDAGAVMQAMDSMDPSSPDAPLAESLYHATGMFPGQCVSNRCILLVTAGIPFDDGHLPAWLKDYDNDDNPADEAFDREGSHCLDDVSAYARSLGIPVHVMGPDTAFLRGVAVKGGGTFMPGRDGIAPEGSHVTGPLVMHGGRPLVLSNLRACFHPAWLTTDTGPRSRPSVTNPLDRVVCPDISLSGILESFTYDSTYLFCTTTGNRLVGIDLIRKELSWLHQGTGGCVLARGTSLLAGPDRKGLVSKFSRGGHLSWQQQGSCMDASDSLVYVGNGSTILSYTLEEGTLVSLYDTAHGITSVCYDPVAGTVTAGTTDGLLYLFDQNLAFMGVLSSGSNAPVIAVRPFTMRRSVRFLVVTRDRLLCATASGPVWSLPLDRGEPVGVTVMDGHVFVVAWDGEVPCRGFDSGMSSLLEIDASTGEVLHTEALGAGIVFGPSIDVDSASMRFVTGSGDVIERGISSLQGVLPCKLGKKILRAPE